MGTGSCCLQYECKASKGPRLRGAEPCKSMCLPNPGSEGLRFTEGGSPGFAQVSKTHSTCHIDLRSALVM
jgi:hypothetical protein